MASQSLYRKWRSQTFSDLIGQEAVVRTLLNAVRDRRLSHAYLFCGPRGTGKTSAARLLAKAINCERPHDGEPCGECISCQEIATGRSPDVIEIDAASNNGVQDIRDLRETVGFMSASGRSRVYIIDEAHMLSPQAWNALLKTLGGAAAARHLCLRDDRSPQDAADRGLALPAVRLPAHSHVRHRGAAAACGGWRGTDPGASGG